MKFLFRFRLNLFSRLNVVRSRTLIWTQTETKTAFPSSSNAQTLKPRLQTTQVLIPNFTWFQNQIPPVQAPGLLRKTMQPNLQEDLFSEQQSATFTLWANLLYFLPTHLSSLGDSAKYPTILFNHCKLLDYSASPFLIDQNAKSNQVPHYYLGK